MTEHSGDAIALVRSFIASMTRPPGHSLSQDEIRAAVGRHVRIEIMAASITGPAWKTAAPAQRERLCAVLLDLVAKHMAAPFTSEAGSIRVHPLRGGVERRRVEVPGDKLRANGSAIKLSWRVDRDRSGPFIYDATCDGVSILESLRSQFSEVLRREGVDGLAARLKALPG